MKSTKLFWNAILVATILLLSVTSNAAQSPIPPNAVLHIQNFKNYPIDIQFRYINKQLSYVRFQNISQIPLSLKVYNEAYILGPGDAVIIDPPHTEFMSYTISPYASFQTTLNNLFPNRFAIIDIFKLPNLTNSSVDK